MKTEYYKEIQIKTELPRDAAEKLRKLLKGQEDFKKIVESIEQQFKPVYTYKFPCIGCGKTCHWAWDKKLTNEEAKNRWADCSLCESCLASEDFK